MILCCCLSLSHPLPERMISPSFALVCFEEEEEVSVTCTRFLGWKRWGNMQ